jgi:hypothetical protein
MDMKETCILDRPQSVQKLLDRLEDFRVPQEREAVLALLQGVRPAEGQILELGLKVGDEGKTLALAALGVAGRPAGVYYGKLVALSRPDLGAEEFRENLLRAASRQALSAVRRRAFKDEGLLGRWREAYVKARPGLPPLPGGLFPVRTEARPPLFFTLAEDREGNQTFLLAGDGGKSHASLEPLLWSRLLEVPEEDLIAHLEDLLGKGVREDPAKAVDRYAALQAMATC